MRGVFAHSGVVRPGIYRRVLVVCALLAALAVQSVAAQSSGLRVVPLVRDGHVFVSFDLRDGFTSDVRAAIHSGLKTSFTYTVELRLDVPGWLDRTIGTAVVTNTVKFDNLHREYALEQLLDGRIEKAQHVENDEAVVRTWMTQLERKPLFRTDGLQPNREYYVRVTASARPSNGSMLWPFGSGTSSQTKFIFIR